MDNRLTQTTLFLIISIISIILFTTPSVFAAGGGYYFVVQSDGSTTDVLTGVNFAASMKASVATTFSSALDKAPADAIVSVYVDGESVRIVGEGEVAEAAETYFERLGFSITTERESPQKDEYRPVDEEPITDDTDAVVETSDDPTDEVSDTGDDSVMVVDVTTTVGTDSPSAPAPATTTDNTDDVQGESFFSRIATWFKELFG